MEILFAIGIFGLAAAGLALGLALGRGPLRGSCGGVSCSCARPDGVCPRKATKAEQGPT